MKQVVLSRGGVKIMSAWGSIKKRGQKLNFPQISRNFMLFCTHLIYPKKPDFLAGAEENIHLAISLKVSGHRRDRPSQIRAFP